MHIDSFYYLHTRIWYDSYHTRMHSSYNRGYDIIYYRLYTRKTIHTSGAVHTTDVNLMYSVRDSHPKFAWIFERRSLEYALRLHSDDGLYQYV